MNATLSYLMSRRSELSETRRNAVRVFSTTPVAPIRNSAHATITRVDSAMRAVDAGIRRCRTVTVTRTVTVR